MRIFNLINKFLKSKETNKILTKFLSFLTGKDSNNLKDFLRPHLFGEILNIYIGIQRMGINSSGHSKRPKDGQNLYWEPRENP